MIHEEAVAVMVAHTVDNRGRDCASGYVKLSNTVDELESGDVLRVLSTDRSARRELRDWAERSGNTILESSTNGPFWRREYQFLIRKG